VTTRTTLDWNAIRIGDALTPMTIDVTATVVVAGAIATRDFMPVHHDRDYAASQGSPNIFMNIITDNGYCSRFLTDWPDPSRWSGRSRSGSACRRTRARCSNTRVA
jgi:hypothetical protein